MIVLVQRAVGPDRVACVGSSRCQLGFKEHWIKTQRVSLSFWCLQPFDLVRSCGSWVNEEVMQRLKMWGPVRE